MAHSIATDALWKLLGLASEAFVIVDEAGTIRYVNRAAERLFGYEPGELAGQLLEVLVPDEYKVAHVADRERYTRAPVARSMGSRAELFAQRKDGGRIPVRIGLSYGHEHGHTYVMAVIVDVTERKAAEASLAQTTSELAAIFQALPDTFIRLSAAGRVLACHQRQEAGPFGPPREVAGRAMQELLSEDVRAPFERALVDVRERGEARRFELSAPPGPRGHCYEARLVPLGEAEVLMVVRDITARKQRESMLLQATKLAAIGEIAGNVAHEVNNPIGIVSAKARLLLSDPREQLSPKVRSELTKMVEQCDRIGLLTRSLLEFARPPASAERVPVDVHEPLEKALAMVRGRSKKGACEVVRELAEGLPPVVANPNELQQVFLNLLINAADAIPDGGRITARTRVGLTLESARPAIAVEIEDTGYGIDEEAIGRIFEPFFTTKGEVKGTGLGLAICRNIVGAHGGTIEARSAPGKGAVFVVTLPASA